MPDSLERKKDTTQIPEGVKHRPEELSELSADLEKAGVQVRPTQFTAQVTDDHGQTLIQTPATQTITIQIPAAQAQLEDWSHGSPANSLTWFATFWLRLIKKAIRFGWKVVASGGNN